MNKLTLLQKFKEQILIFLDELIEQIPTEGDLVILRILIKDQVSIEKIMNHFVKKLLPFKYQIDNRDEKFFLENEVLLIPVKKKNWNKKS